jgi:hypothetical protein
MGGEDKFDYLRVQSAALPTELPGHIEPHDKTVKKRNYSKNSPFYLPPSSYWLIQGSAAFSLAAVEFAHVHNLYLQRIPFGEKFGLEYTKGLASKLRRFRQVLIPCHNSQPYF